MRRFGASVLVVLLASLLTTTAFAQNATTSLRGVVKDPSGAVVPGATITLDDKANGQHLVTKSKSDGEYQLLQIPPAKYTIKITANGFAEQTKIAELLVNQPATVNVSLSIKESTDVVDVTAASQTINTVDASLGGSASNAMIQALPSETRNVPDLLSLQPGVLYLPNVGDDSRNGSVNGGRSDQGNVTLDGVDDNDQVGGYAFFGVLRETQDSVEEFRVTTGNGNADEGRSSGAQISLLTKSGTNKIHGAAYEYNRPTNTVSNDFFNKQGQLNQGLANRPPKLIRNIFGADIGGPIIKDKLFLFANYEATRQAESAVVVQTVPTAAYYAGNLTYTDSTGGTSTVTGPGTLSNQMQALDGTVCAICNTPAYPPNPGTNPNVLTYFHAMPAANGLTVGDQLNTGSYTFASPNPVALNTTIIRLDYVPSAKHRIFARGNLQKDTTLGTINFPGQPPASKTVDNTKGMTFGDTWTVSSNIVNDIRYGYIRQGYGIYGIGSGDYVDFRFLSSPTAETRTTIASVPVNNIVDTLNITKGKHDLQMGVNWRLVHQNRHSNAASYNSASTNPYWLGDSPPDPSAIGLNSVSNGFENSYLIAYANLVGTVPSVTDQSNYLLTSATSGTLLADGAYLDRHFKANEFETYLQDAYHVRPNLTITFGVRWTTLQTPWETHGQEVTPTTNTDDWYKQREANALQGIIYEPNLTFAPAGPYYGKPGLYAKAKDNVSPRFAIVYSPNNKTSIRAGAGTYFDHFGQGLINVYDQNGAFGLSNSVTNPAATEYIENSPRFISRTALPFNNGAVPAQLTFPYTPLTTAATDFAITYGIDNRIRTPYTEAFDLSLQRELPGGFTIETNYVGRMGRHLLQSTDLTQPVDYVDPAGGGDYYTAGTALAKLVDANGGYNGNATLGSGKNQYANVPKIPYFENVFPYLKNYDYNGESATQAIYSNEWSYNRASLGETESIADLDFFCYEGCPAGHQSRFWQNQFASLYSLTSTGMSYYNALQITVHHPSSHGIQFDVNYTFSKSEDWGSDTERFGGNGGNSAIINTWKPYLNKAVSDFDTKQLVTANMVDQLPFGKGKAFFGNVRPVVNSIIGGWQLSGIFRWSSGLPFSFFEPGYTTDWQDPSYAVVTNPSAVKVHKHLDANTDPQYFDNPTGINNGISSGTPIRLPYPGEAGQRNNFRADGFINLDTGLSKSWQLEKYGTLKFSWEVYNATNTVRFDPFSIDSQLSSGSLGVASSELTAPRRMQFSLRYDF
jgi:hypothetical protein